MPEAEKAGGLHRANGCALATCFDGQPLGHKETWQEVLRKSLRRICCDVAPCGALRKLRMPPGDAQGVAAALPSLLDVCSSAARALPVPGTSLDVLAAEDFEEAAWLDTLSYGHT